LKKLAKAFSSGAFAGALEVAVLTRDGKFAPDSVVIVRPSGTGRLRAPNMARGLAHGELPQR